MAHDVFISHSSKDKAIADAVCATLEARGIRCWIAPRDIAPGESWPRAITHAVEASRVMVLVVSANANLSDQIGREVTLAATHGLTIIPLRVEAVTPNAELAYYLLRVHWLDAITPPLEQHLKELADRVALNLAARRPHGAPSDASTPTAAADGGKSTAAATAAEIERQREEHDRRTREREEHEREEQARLEREREDREREAREQAGQAQLERERREKADLEQAQRERELAEQREREDRARQEREQREREEREREEREERGRRARAGRRLPAWASGRLVLLGLAVTLAAIGAAIWLGQSGLLTGEVRRFAGHEGQVDDVVFSADGRRLLSGSHDGTARLWDVDSGREIRRVRIATTNVGAVAFLPDGARFLTGGSLMIGSGANALELWNAETGNRIRAFTINSYIYGIAVAPDGRRAISANGPRNAFNLWDLDQEQPIREYTFSTLGTTFARSAAYSPDGRRLLLGDDRVHLLDADSGRELRQLGEAATGGAVAWAPDGRSVVTNGPAVVLWDAETGQEQRRIANTDNVNRVAFSPDGRRILTGDTSGFVRLFDAQTGQELRRFKADQYQMTSVAFSPDGRRAAAAGWGSTFRLWALPD